MTFVQKSHFSTKEKQKGPWCLFLSKGCNLPRSQPGTPSNRGPGPPLPGMPGVGGFPGTPGAVEDAEPMPIRIDWGGWKKW